MTPKEFNKHIGNVIRSARERNNLTQKELQDLSGITQSQLSQIESGEKSISLHRFHELMELLNAEIDTNTADKIHQYIYGVEAILSDLKSLLQRQSKNRTLNGASHQVPNR